MHQMTLQHRVAPENKKVLQKMTILRMYQRGTGAKLKELPMAKAGAI